MTEEDQLLLNELSINVKLLFEKCKKQHVENITLSEHISVLTKEISRLQQQKEELTFKVEKLLAANALIGGDEDKGVAKSRIDRLIREIDKCIALLNR